MNHKRHDDDDWLLASLLIGGKPVSVGQLIVLIFGTLIVGGLLLWVLRLPPFAPIGG